MNGEKDICNEAGAGDGAGAEAGAGAVSNDRAASSDRAGMTDRDGTMRTYAPEQVVCVECEHVREMVGESDVVLRRTRSEAAENAVLNAVREGGVEPDWFVERWMEEEKVLVACAVFEDGERCAGFRKGVQEWIAKLEERGEESPVRIRSDAKLEAAVARHFTEEWRRRREEQMAKYRAVIADAKRGGEYAGRVVVGEYKALDEDAKAAFGKIAEELNAASPKDGFGDGGIAYSGFWDKGNVARFCFGFPSAEACDAAKEVFKKAKDGWSCWIDVADPLEHGDELDAVDLEMAALVIAKMQGEAKAKAAREEMERKLDAAKAEAEKGKQGAAELMD